jgi:hypothetical protein
MCSPSAMDTFNFCGVHARRSETFTRMYMTESTERALRNPVDDSQAAPHLGPTAVLDNPSLPTPFRSRTR